MYSLLSYFEANPVIFSALIAAGIGLIGNVVSYRAIKTAYRRSLDSESEWRKMLFGAATAEKITVHQIQILRAALRYGKYKEPKRDSYELLTNSMIAFCDYVRLNKSKNEYLKHENVLDEEIQETARIFIRCVLKHNWEVNEKSNHHRYKCNNNYIQDTIDMVINELSKMHNEQLNQLFNTAHVSENKELNTSEKKELIKNKLKFES